MFTCIALYRGTTFSDLELVSLTTDRLLIGEVAEKLAARATTSQDPAVSARKKGIRKAPRVIAREGSHD